MVQIRFADDRAVFTLPDRPAHNTIAEVATGMGKAVEGLISFPYNTTHYIFSGPNTFHHNILTRAAESVNHVVMGTLDLLSAHYLYSGAKALGIEHYTPWFTPFPATIEGAATDVTNLAFLATFPAAGRAIKTQMGIPKKVALVSEAAFNRQLAPATQSCAEALPIADFKALAQPAPPVSVATKPVRPKRTPPHASSPLKLPKKEIQTPGSHEKGRGVYVNNTFMDRLDASRWRFCERVVDTLGYGDVDFIVMKLNQILQAESMLSTQYLDRYAAFRILQADNTGVLVEVRGVGKVCIVRIGKEGSSQKVEVKVHKKWTDMPLHRVNVRGLVRMVVDIFGVEEAIALRVLNEQAGLRGHRMLVLDAGPNGINIEVVTTGHRFEILKSEVSGMKGQPLVPYTQITIQVRQESVAKLSERCHLPSDKTFAHGEQPLTFKVAPRKTDPIRRTAGANPTVKVRRAHQSPYPVRDATQRAQGDTYGHIALPRPSSNKE